MKTSAKDFAFLYTGPWSWTKVKAIQTDYRLYG